MKTFQQIIQMLGQLISGIFLAIFVSRFGTFFAQNQCTPRTPINVTLQDLVGKWYVIAYVNETNESELEQTCIKQIYRYIPERNAINESRTVTWTTTGQTVTTYNEFTFVEPGLINTTTDNDNTIVNYYNRILEYKRGDSFIFSNCLTINGTMYTDRLSLFMSRQHVSDRTIRRKFASIGIQLNDVNVLFRIRQKNCSYEM